MIGPFTQLGKLQGHAGTLDLSAQPMRTLKDKIQDVWTAYISEFPPHRPPHGVPNASADRQAQSSGHTATEIRASSRFENAHEYQMGLAQWGQQYTTSVDNSVEDYISKGETGQDGEG